MKKIVFAFTFVFLIASMLNAQNMNFGFELGSSFTNLAYSENFDFWDPEITSSINFMVFSEFNYSNSFLQQFGFRYVQHGSHIKYENFHDFEGQSIHIKGNHDLKQNYISIPLRVIYNFGRNSVFVFTGPEFTYLISASYDHHQESPDPESNSYAENITNDVNRLNISIGMGLGLSFPLLKQKFYFITQYSHGITSNAKKDRWAFNWKTRELSISVGYYLLI